MDTIERYKNSILEIDKFVRELDPAVRGEAFRFLMEKAVPAGDRDLGGMRASTEERIDEQNERIMKKLSGESRIPIDRLMEVYVVNDSSVQVIDSSIPNEGPTDLVKKITLLCAYGNIVGTGRAKMDVSIVYKNLKDLRAATTSYSRDAKSAEGVKVLADGGVMLTPDGREKAQALLKEILKPI